MLFSECALREIYLRGFEIAVKDSNPLALMMSYNQLNGAYTGCNRDLVTDILRCEWGYKDLVMTDQGTKYDPAAALHAQVHMTMPGCDAARDAVLAGLTNGSIPSHIAFAKGQRKFLWADRIARVNLRGGAAKLNAPRRAGYPGTAAACGPHNA